MICHWCGDTGAWRLHRPQPSRSRKSADLCHIESHGQRVPLIPHKEMPHPCFLPELPSLAHCRGLSSCDLALLGGALGIICLQGIAAHTHHYTMRSFRWTKAAAFSGLLFHVIHQSLSIFFLSPVSLHGLKGHCLLDPDSRPVSSYSVLPPVPPMPSQLQAISPAQLTHVVFFSFVPFVYLQKTHPPLCEGTQPPPVARGGVSLGGGHHQRMGRTLLTCGISGAALGPRHFNNKGLGSNRSTGKHLVSHGQGGQ